MKKNLLFSALIVMVVSSLTLTSCGSSVGLGKQKAKSPAQKYAESVSTNTLCGWGQYNGFSDQNLEAFAATNARASLAKEIETFIQAGIRIYDSKYSVRSVDVGEKADGIKAGDEGDHGIVEEAASAIISGSRVVMSDRYVQKDGTETCYTAVEINPDAVINYMKQNKEFKEAISRSRKEEIDYDSQKFKESMQQAFDELKKARGN